jgi:hypothetical protein
MEHPAALPALVKSEEVRPDIASEKDNVYSTEAAVAGEAGIELHEALGDVLSIVTEDELSSEVGEATFESVNTDLAAR